MARIILIDDDEPFSTALAERLRAAGHGVWIAPNGFAGAARHRTEPADLILTDIEIPYGGFATIRVLRMEFPAVPIIALSGRHSQLNMAAALGADRAIAKPFTFAQLTAAITAVS